MRNLLLAMLLVLAGATAGAAAAAPVIPGTQQLQIKALLVQLGAAELALAPSRLPGHFAFDSYSVTGTPLGLDISFADQRFLANPIQARQHEISFDASYVKGTVSSCASRGRRVKTPHEAVYTDGATVWRCVRTPRGRVVKETAKGRATAKVLADVVVSVGPMR